MFAQRQVTRLAGLVVGLGLIGAASPAGAFGLDGILTGADSYTASFDLDFLVEGKSSDPNTQVSGNVLKIGRDGADGNIFVFLKVSGAIVDNVYGDNLDPLTGWNPPAHPFSKLVGSDAFQFELNVGGSDRTIKVEYIETDGSVEIKANDGAILVGAATSLQYNLAQGFGTTGSDSTAVLPDPINGTPPAGWVREVQYEFEFDGSQFASGTSIALADISMAILHASPNLLGGDNKVRVCGLSDFSTVGGVLCTTTPPGDPPGTSVPEPMSTALFGFGLLGLWLLRRRQAEPAGVAK